LPSTVTSTTSLYAKRTRPTSPVRCVHRGRLQPTRQHASALTPKGAHVTTISRFPTGTTYAFVTVGAAAAHRLGFKKGGLKSLVEAWAATAKSGSFAPVARKAAEVTLANVLRSPTDLRPCDRRRRRG